MPRTAQDDIIKLYIRNILIECSPDEGDNSDLDGLKLKIFSELDHDIELARSSKTTWKQQKKVPRQVAGPKFLVSASSDGSGDLGYIEIDLKVWPPQKSGPAGSRQGKVSKRELVPLGHTPELVISFDVFSSTFHKVGRKRLDASVREIDPSDIYEALQLVDDDSPTKPDSLNFCGAQLMIKFKTTQCDDDIKMAIEAYEKAIALLCTDDPRMVDFIENQGRGWWLRYDASGQLADIDEAIKKYQVVLAATASGHEKIPDRLDALGRLFNRRFQQSGNLVDILTSVQFHRQAVQLDGLPVRLQGLGISLLDYFRYNGELRDLSEAIEILKHAIEITSEGDEYLPTMLSNLGNSIFCRYERSGDMTDISNSIRLHERAVQLTPNDHADFPDWLSNLANLFRNRFERLGELADISESINLHQQAVQLTLPRRAKSPTRFSNLGIAFLRRFERTGDMADISKSIEILQLAVHLTPEGHAKLPVRLTNLGSSVFCRFERTGDMGDILEAIRIQRLAIQLTPDGRADLPCRLSNLGNSLVRFFERNGELADISESIRLLQCAVYLTPHGDAQLPTRLSNLGSSFLARFDHTGDLADLSESIKLKQHSVKLTPDEHADLPARLNNLGGSFLARFGRTGKVTDISESIRVRRHAVQLTPDGHASLPIWLNNLGNSLIRWFEQSSPAHPAGTCDLTAPALQPWECIFSSLHRDQNVTDASESIQLHEHALRLTPAGSVDLPVRLYNLGLSFHRSFEHTQVSEAFIKAISHYRMSAMATTGSHSTRIKAARQWAELSKMAKPFSSSQLLDAHERIIQLLSLITGYENTLKRRHDLLVESSSISTAAAAAALSVDNPGKALEWLEQGRCIIWNQINQLRAPIDKLHAYDPALANRLSVLSRQLENAGSRPDPRYGGVELSMPAQISLETQAHNHLKLSKERDELLITVRNIPGFENFLRPRSYAKLMIGLPEDGLVVIINANKDRCDALALMTGCDEPMHIPLVRLSYEKVGTLAQELRSFLSSRRLRSRYSEEAEEELRAGGPTRHHSPRDQLHKVLHTLWNDLVEPILKALGFAENDKDLPRIWWCPTGPFAFLPIHAAGIYKEGNCDPGHCLADFAISSYIPTLNILERLRSRPVSETPNNGILLVSQPDTPGFPRIPKTSEEVQKTREELDKRGIQSALYQGEDATVKAISESLESYSCVHLACHASQDVKDPLESALHLYDGPLKLAKIMKKDLPSADLAFLSACQTSAGDEKLPEESVHLAAGMLAAGYRSVISTMWSISDIHAPQVAQTFYGNLLSDDSNEGGQKLDVTTSARALHVTTRRLRTNLGSSAEALLVWIPYVHFGI